MYRILSALGESVLCSCSLLLFDFFFVYSPFTFVLACQGIGETTGLLEISVTDAFFPVTFPTKRDLCQRFAKISLILSFFLHPFGCGLCFLLIKKI